MTNFKHFVTTVSNRNFIQGEIKGTLIPIVRMGKMRSAYKFWSAKPEARGSWEDLCVDGRLILAFILGK